jgi:hypothetical protein
METANAISRGTVAGTVNPLAGRERVIVEFEWFAVMIGVSRVPTNAAARRKGER